MEAQERPWKIRKLNPSIQAENEATPLLEAIEVNGNPISDEPHDRTPGEVTGNDDLLKPGEAQERLSKVRKLNPSSQLDDEVALFLEAAEVNGKPVSNGTQGGTAAEVAGNDNPIKPKEDVPAEPRMSKNMRKKLRKQEQWEAGREFRKIQRREKVRKKKQLKRAASAKQPPSDATLAATVEDIATAASKDAMILKELPVPPKVPAKAKSTKLPITFIFDCSFDDLMLDKERISLTSQLTRCYSDNQRAKYKAHLAVSSFSGHLKERFNNTLLGHYKSWKGFKFLEDDFVEVADKAKEWMAGNQGGVLSGMFSKLREDPSTSVEQLMEKGEVVYLTSDSPDTLTELKPYSTYIIGGIVDKNRHKGICYKRAMDRGMKTARLPIGDYLEMTSRFVLTTNHVSEIMLKWLELGDWGETLLEVIPKRKRGSLKKTGGTAEGDSNAVCDSNEDPEVEKESIPTPSTS